MALKAINNVVSFTNLQMYTLYINSIYQSLNTLGEDNSAAHCFKISFKECI